MTDQCTQFRLFTTALLHDELASADKAKTEKHLSECAECKEYFQTIQQLEMLLKSAIPQVEIPSVKNEVMRKIGETEKNLAIRKELMTIRFNCSSCKRHFEAEPKHIGKKMKCPKCGTVNAVPQHSTIAPKQVRPPSNISNADTGQMPAISRNVAVSNSETPLVGELPTVKEVRRITSEINSQAPQNRVKRRRLPSEASIATGARRPENMYPQAPQKSSKQKNLVIGISAVGFILVILLAIMMFTGENPETTPIAEDTNVDNVKPENIKPDLNPHKPTGIVETPEENPEPEDKKDIENEPPVEPLEIISTALPRTEFPIYEENIRYSIEATGGVKPYKYDIMQGRLPDGLVLINDVIQGDINEAGQFTFTIQVTDAQNNIKTIEFSITVYDVLTIGDNAPDDMELNKEYSFTLVVTGGKAPYTCAVVGKNLPKGVDFDNETMTLRGTPLEPGSPFFLELSVTDSIGQQESWSGYWEIEAPEEAEPEVKKPEDKKDETELEKPEDEVKKPDIEKEDPGLSQTELRLLLMQYTNQARALFAAKKYEEAIAMYAKVLELDDMNAGAYYNTACAYSLLKNKDKAVEFLEAAIKAGFRDLKQILSDPDLDYIKHDKRFRALTKNQDVINELSMDAIKSKVDKEFPSEEGFLKRINHENKLIFATNLGDNKEQCRAILDMLTERIENYAKAQWKKLFKKKPKYYITVALPKKQWFDRYKLRKGFPAMVGGWYNPTDKFLIAGTMGHTLTHEFTHAMHYADLEGRTRKGKPDKNMHIWFTEGIATCFEDCQLPEKSTQKPEPVYNTRISQMVGLVKSYSTNGSKERRYWNWRKFFSQARPTFMRRDRALISYAQSRSITLWLYRLNKLKRYYEYYMDSCDNGTDDGKNGITAMEKLFKMKLEDIEQEWIKWMLEFEKLETPKAYIGITASRNPSNMGMGVVIESVNEGSSAEEAGLKAGDIIVTFNRIAIDHMNHLLVAILECKIGQKVDCVVIRDGKPMEFKVKLKRKP